jgi:hypothetical protein
MPSRPILQACRKIRAPSAQHDAEPPRRVQETTLFYHLVGDGEQRGWNVETERPRGDPVDHQLELGRLLDWQVGRLGAAPCRHSPRRAGSNPESSFHTTLEQNACLGELALWEHGRQARGEREGVDTQAQRAHQRVTGRVERLRTGTATGVAAIGPTQANALYN